MPRFKPAIQADTAEAPSALRERASIAAEYKWDFTPIYADWAAWEASLGELQRQMDAFIVRKGSLNQGSASLLAAYQALDEIGKLQYRVYRYTQLQHDVDTRDQTVAAHNQRVGAAFARFEAATAWFTPELLAIPQATVQQWLDEDAGLAPYRFPILDAFRKQAHVLDEAGERLLALSAELASAPGEAYEALSTTDIRFPSLTLASGEALTLSPGAYQALLHKHRVQADRGRAAAAHLGTYAAQGHTYAALYRGVMQSGWFEAQARGFADTLDAALHDHAIPRSVVENLLHTTRNGVHALQRYARLRRKLLGLNEYHLYDAFLPILEGSASYGFEQARELALASAAPLGQAYGQRYRRFMAGGWIDVYETEGKQSGAYSAGVYGVGPYQLLNYNDTLDSVFTLAHEGGHAMHTVLSHEHQPFATSEYTIFVAEVASTINERFLLEHLLAHSTDANERFLLLQHAVDEIVGTFYVQVLFADFERQAHQLVERGQAVTEEALGAIYLSLLRHYYGDAVQIDDFYRHTWARIPHFYGSPYYVYQYATCFASSAVLFKAMTQGEPQAREAATQRYLELLKSGGNDHPMEQLRKAGVDLGDPATVQAVVAQMDELVARMELEAEKLQRPQTP